ncbi:MAG: non-canonical purine NTP pyrophosphatase, RdgB/HAM1 family [Verrucomicrobia bacterium]|nr:MAG: non-canonical purine NTP pyrophosphatase, RdgB/HAM1 family [Verrucomicrobiota bacterium]
MQHLIVATRNAHKAREIQRILGPDFAVRDLSDYPQISKTAEMGKTFEENAILKAAAASKELPGLVIADDSGLEVYALDGAPGIYSARYAGQNASDKENIDKLLGELSRRAMWHNFASCDSGAGQVANLRHFASARFCCVIALAHEGELLGTFEGTVEGTIVERASGSHGFGYDPIFVPNGFGQTFAELPAEVKNNISHRTQATRALAAKLAALKLSDQGLGGGGGGAPGC